MEKHRAFRLIQENHLIPGDISRKILRQIVNNKELEDVDNKIISFEQFNELKRLYFNKKNELDKKNEPFPKYLPFYLIIHEKLPQVSWEIKEIAPKKFAVNFKAPTKYNLRLSLLSLLLDKIENNTCTLLSKGYDCVSQLPKKIIEIFSMFLEKSEALFPDEFGMNLVINWLTRCLADEKSTIFIPLCPDYSAKPIENSKYLFKYTLTSLGNHNGLVAKKIIDILPDLYKLFNIVKINPKLICAIADFEAFSVNTLKQLRLTEDEFLSRVEESRRAFEKETNILPIMISEVCGGKNKWIEITHQIKDSFLQNEFGCIDIDFVILRNIARKRKSIYSRWNGKKMSIDESVQAVIEQGADYAAMGKFISENLNNCLVIAADNKIMSPFYNYLSFIPTLFVKRYYC